MESDEVGHMVALISAEDADGDKIWYSIIGEWVPPGRWFDLLLGAGPANQDVILKEQKLKLI